jgi:hypothetical protein
VIVATSDSPLLAAQLELSPFAIRALRADSVEWLDEIFLQEYVRTPLLLIVDENSYLDDQQALESHLALHNIHREAVAIGGRLLRSNKSSVMDEALDLKTADEFDAGRMDDLRAFQVATSHVSFKTSALRAHLATHGPLELRLITPAMSQAGQLVLLIDNLNVRFDRQISIAGFISTGFRNGQLKRQCREAGYIPERHYYRVLVPRDVQLRTYPHLKSVRLAWLWQIYDLAYSSGYASHTDASATSAVLGHMFAHWIQFLRVLLASIWQAPFFTELYCALRFALSH